MTSEEASRKARSLLEDTIVLQIFASLETKYISEWRNTPPADVQKREAAFAGIRALEDFKARLGSLANAPRVEAHNNRNATKR